MDAQLYVPGVQLGRLGVGFSEMEVMQQVRVPCSRKGVLISRHGNDH